MDGTADRRGVSRTHTTGRVGTLLGTAKRPGTAKPLAAAAVAILAAAAAFLFMAPPPAAADARLTRPTSVRAAMDAPPDDPAVPTVSVSAGGAQRITAIGASGAWWPYTVRFMPDSVQNQIAAMLFGKDGIELSGYRYNIGGGGVGVSNPHHVAPTFLVANGRYDWSADPGGVHFLRLAASYHVPVLSGFVNSAPALFTTDHKSCGGTLIPGKEAAYASYLATVVSHLHRDGLTLSYVSPMNEPDSSFSRCTQEGMSVPVLERAAIIDTLGPALASQAPYARVIADESSQVYKQLLPEAPLWLGSPGVTRWLAAVVHHTYDYPSNAELAAVARLSSRYSVPTWTTEICCYDGQDFGGSYDPTMNNAMWLANSIWQDFTITGDSSFNWWVAVSGKLGCDPVADPTCPLRHNMAGRNDGLVYFDPHFGLDHNDAVYTTKRYWVLGNFSRFVRPGALRHPSSSTGYLRTVAFSDPDHWTLVVVDNAPDHAGPQVVRVVLPRSAGALSPAGCYETAASADLASKPGPVADGRGGFLVRVDPQSVTTLVFARRSASSSSGAGPIVLASVGSHHRGFSERGAAHLGRAPGPGGT